MAPGVLYWIQVPLPTVGTTAGIVVVPFCGTGLDPGFRGGVGGRGPDKSASGP